MKNRIRELRKSEKLTLKELSQKIGIASNTLSQYETSKREPKLDMWSKLAKYFNVPIPYLQGIGVSEREFKERLFDLIVDDPIFSSKIVNYFKGSSNNFLFLYTEKKKELSKDDYKRIKDNFVSNFDLQLLKDYSLFVSIEPNISDSELKNKILDNLSVHTTVFDFSYMFPNQARKLEKVFDKLSLDDLKTLINMGAKITFNELNKYYNKKVKLLDKSNKDNE